MPGRAVDLWDPVGLLLRFAAIANFHHALDNFVMLETLAVLLIVLWLLGLLTSYTLGGLIHLLLVIAVVAIILRLISGRRV